MCSCTQQINHRKEYGLTMNLFVIGVGGILLFLLAAIVNAAVTGSRKKKIDQMIKNEYEE